jgi:hypothetical protein
VISFKQIPAERPLIVLWQSQWSELAASNAFEHVLVHPGYANGIIVGFDDTPLPFRIQYEIEWDENWCTREVEIDVAMGGRAHGFHLSVDEHANWYNGEGREIGRLAGCRDVDIWPTPFTNTLAIRRLQLGAGDRQEIDVAYIDALAGELMQKRQVYTALPGGDYQFESRESGFTARLAVDEYGLIVDYPGLFARGG